MAKQGHKPVSEHGRSWGEWVLFLQLSEDGGLKTKSLQPGPLISGQDTKKRGGSIWIEPIPPLMLTSSSGKKSWHLMPFCDCEPRPEQRPDSGIAQLLGVKLQTIQKKYCGLGVMTQV